MIGSMIKRKDKEMKAHLITKIKHELKELENKRCCLINELKELCDHPDIKHINYRHDGG